ncbi:KTSC domain-containing protein [Fulvivirga ulvae]|uniref:KTSC domain-containing protein n=1 Tax=Fulvivirga ulvae TaxID=2904245 RepID=UPI001F204A6C|nr:KTSC domain-containing protein [Fulvivirga ulvae]UII32935.1 KTSC domain-containing protein [Fulvivirga ulvae]
MKYIAITIFLLLISICMQAQVEHNFEMEPSNTNCHELPEKFDSPTNAINAIEKSTFRFTQSIKISRYHSPKAAFFYSCDGKTGYMIVDLKDGSREVYTIIPQEVWDEFANTNDPIGYYSTHIEKNYENLQ